MGLAANIGRAMSGEHRQDRVSMSSMRTRNNEQCSICCERLSWDSPTHDQGVHNQEQPGVRVAPSLVVQISHPEPKAFS